MQAVGTAVCYGRMVNRVGLLNSSPDLVLGHWRSLLWCSFCFVFSFCTRIFRRRKRPRQSLVGLFNMRASNSWLDSTACSDMESPCGETAWHEGCSQVDASRYHDNGEQWLCTLWYIFGLYSNYRLLTYTRVLYTFWISTLGVSLGYPTQTTEIYFGTQQNHFFKKDVIFIKQ